MVDNNKLLKIITIILSVLLIGSAFQLYTSLEKINLQNQAITGLTAETNAQKETISGLEISVNNLKQNLSTSPWSQEPIMMSWPWIIMTSGT
ncbi:MAG: hypothetical protein O8C67_07160 [Candidatus Methanoperedens sp.]|nr:hypothetical protein [Candidatus Methanoperedens sp.]